ncbi:hypothetical protein TNCT1_39060 [Streptomyces sp. 1-11]|nr:hypothetical protein TNCT1_39060 [Streptomyces sp. 1-11]
MPTACPWGVLVARSAISWRIRMSTMSGCVSMDGPWEVVIAFTSERVALISPAGYPATTAKPDLTPSNVWSMSHRRPAVS